MTNKITITEALVKLNLLDKKIAKIVGSMHFHTTEVKATNKVTVGNQSYSSVEEANKRIVSEYSKLESLMNERSNMKGALVASNALTKVTIAGKTMTVAEAIERKSSIANLQNLHSRMASAIEIAVRNEAKIEATLVEKIERQISLVLGNKKTIDAGDTTVQAITKQIRDSEKVIIHNPISVEAKYESIGEEIQEFLANVDVLLTISNSTTFIEY